MSAVVFPAPHGAPAASVADLITQLASVAAGFEHSIANMYFVPVALFHRLLARAGFWRATSTTADDYKSITWPRFVLRNLIPVTLGNIVGGAILVGLTYWFVYMRPSAPD